MMETVTLDLSQHVEDDEYPIEANGKISTSERLIHNILNNLVPNTAAHKLDCSDGTKETFEESDETHSEDHSNSSQTNHSSDSSDGESHVENEEEISRALDAQPSLESPTKPTEEDVERLREELDKNLQEEQMLISLQMQLLLQLRKLKAAIQAAESEEGLARLASQQAKVIRLLQYEDEEDNIDDEVITIQVRY
jgi:hypothetical protein